MCDFYSLDSRCVSPPCGINWAMEPANFYESSRLVGPQAGLCKPGSGPEEVPVPAAELSGAPAMYEDESAIDFSQYIESMTAVPNLELCNDELFLDLFNTVKQEKVELFTLQTPDLQPADALPLAGGRGSEAGLERTLFPAPIKQEADWSSDLSSSLPSQIETCAQTSVSIPTGQPTPPSTPEPSTTSSPSSGASARGSPRRAGRERAGRKAVDRGSAEYRQRRERNNIAVRKSRDKAKRRNIDMQQKLLELSSENDRLHKTIDQLSRELTGLRDFFKRVPSASFPARAATEGR